MTYRFTSDEKNALKAAIARHPDWKAYRQRHGIASISNLSKDQLIQTAQVFGIDIDSAILQGRADTAAAINRGREIADSMQDEGQGEGQGEGQDEGQGEGQGEGQDTDPAVEKINRDVAQVLEPLGRQDFEGFNTRLRSLAAEANKPPRIETVEKLIQVTAPLLGEGQEGNALPMATPQKTGTVGSVFGVRGKMGGLPVTVWDAQDTPPIESDFEYIPEIIGLMAVAVANGDYVWLSGPAGTGKTSLPMQFAANTKRPFVRIPLDGALEPVDLIGMTVPAKEGGTTFKPGVLTTAIQQPGTIILLDEPTYARPGVLALLQTVLDYRFLILKEHGGQRIDVAPGVVFMAADNTNGTGDETGHYVGTGPMNRAFLDRFSVTLTVPYLPDTKEARALAARASCRNALATEIVRFAGLTRSAEEQGNLTMAMGLRRMVAWAKLLHAGIDPKTAFLSAVINTLSPDDRETYHQLYSAELKDSKLSALAKGETSAPEATRPENRDAQSDFAPVSQDTVS